MYNGLVLDAVNCWDETLSSVNDWKQVKEDDKTCNVGNQNDTTCKWHHALLVKYNYREIPNLSRILSSLTLAIVEKEGWILAWWKARGFFCRWKKILFFKPIRTCGEKQVRCWTTLGCAVWCFQSSRSLDGRSFSKPSVSGRCLAIHSTEKKKKILQEMWGEGMEVT